MPRSKPNWKFPCIICKKCARKDQKFFTCPSCKKRVHLKCIVLSDEEYHSYVNGVYIFCCVECKPVENNTNNAPGSPSPDTPQNVEFPCVACNSPVDHNHTALMCDTCTRWVHHSCTDLSQDQYDKLESDINTSFYCLLCKPRPSYASIILDDNAVDDAFENSINESLSSINISAHSSDFEFIDDET